MIEDITFCVNQECDKRNKCLRYTDKQIKYDENILVSIAYFDNENCRYFIPIHEE